MESRDTQRIKTVVEKEAQDEVSGNKTGILNVADHPAIGRKSLKSISRNAAEQIITAIHYAEFSLRSQIFGVTLIVNLQGRAQDGC